MSMVLYHVTLKENLESILNNGLLASEDGLDGPGIYLWKGPQESAVMEADFSLADNHYQMSQEEYEAFTKNLVMLAVTVPDNAVFSIDWPEYVVLDNCNVPPSCVASLGSFDVLLERYCPQQTVSKLIAEAEARSEGIDVSAGNLRNKDFENVMD